MFLTEQVEKILPQVTKPGRYMGGELNSIIRNPEEAELNFGFCFPDTYEIGMSYLGLQIIYDVLNKKEGVYCQRIFAPDYDMEKLMRAEHIPLFTAECHQSAESLDVLGFSLSYELCYTNVLNMLELANIPIMAGDRNDRDPYICAGGNCTFNPEPAADFFDFFMIGDGEDVILEVSEILKDAKKSGAGRRETLVRLAGIPGVYVPSLYEVKEDEKTGYMTVFGKTDPKLPDKIRKRIISDMDSVSFPEKPIVPLIEVVHDRSVMEIFRGCTRGCRFCQAGMICRPVREKSPDVIKKQAEGQLKNTGYDEMSLLSLSTSDYSQVESLVTDLMNDCKQRKVGLSLPSMRLDSFSFRVLQEIQEFRKSGLTFAPEAGTQRLRNVINKTITEEDIYTAAEKAISLGWTNIKLYFMIGLPTETDEDLDGIIEIARKINEIYANITQRRTRFNLTVSVSNFVPKPHTPFQWVKQDSPAELNRKHMYLKEGLKNIKGVSYQYHDSDTSTLEAVLARGDRKVCAAIARAHELGCRADSWSEFFRYDLWLQAFEETALDYKKYTENWTLEPGDRLPWDIIDCGVSSEFLTREYELAKNETQTPDCRHQCQVCGITDMAKCPAFEGFFNNNPEKNDAAYAINANKPADSNKTAPREPGRSTGEPRCAANTRYMLKFTKTGRLRYISHLDLLRLFQRFFKRAGVDLAYSSGFNPHAKIGFAQPLSLGFESVGEYMEIETQSEWKPETLVKTLNGTAPEGLRILGAKRLRLEENVAVNTLAAAVSSAVYIVSEEKPTLSTAGLMPDDEGLSAFFAQEAIYAEKLKKKKVGKGKNIRVPEKTDIKGMIKKAEWNVSDGRLVFRWELSTGSSANLNPDLVLDALNSYFGWDKEAIKWRIVRKDMYFTSGNRKPGAFETLWAFKG